MDTLEAITTRLGAKELETLKYFVQKVEQCGSQHLAWPITQRGTITLTDCEVKFPYEEFVSRHASLEALATLQFVSFRTVAGGTTALGEYHLTLHPAALDRVEYERKNPLRKWLSRLFLQYKDYTGVIALFISLALAVIEIVKFIKKIP